MVVVIIVVSQLLLVEGLLVVRGSGGARTLEGFWLLNLHGCRGEGFGLLGAAASLSSELCIPGSSAKRATSITPSSRQGLVGPRSP